MRILQKMTFQKFKQHAIKELTSSPSAALDADVLLQHFTNKDKTYILFHRDEELTDEQETVLKEAIEKRKTGLPVAYITGHKEFYGYDFFVTPDVLIPKPDTEILVENAIKFIKEKTEEKKRALKVLDLCTGSGCIAVSILKFLKEEKIITTELLPDFILADISVNTLKIAEKNSERLLSDSAKKIKFIETNLFNSINEKFDIIVSNPPYVPALETDELLKDGRNEPRLALDGDVNIDGSPSGTTDGLELIRNLIIQSKAHFTKDGILILETGEYNAGKTESFMKQNGFSQTKLYRDLEGQLRNVSGIFNG